MDKENILQDLFDQGYVEKEIEVIPNRRTAIIRNIPVKSQMKIEKEMSEIEGNAAYTIHSYTLKLLSHILVRFGSHTFETPDQAQKFLDDQPSIILDKLAKEMKAFEREIGDALEMENIDEVFLKGAGQIEDSGQSSEEQIPAPETPSERQS